MTIMYGVPIPRPSPASQSRVPVPRPRVPVPVLGDPVVFCCLSVLTTHSIPVTQLLDLVRQVFGLDDEVLQILILFCRKKKGISIETSYLEENENFGIKKTKRQ